MESNRSGKAVERFTIQKGAFRTDPYAQVRLIALRDVCDLDPTAIEETFAWLARAIVREGLREAQSGEVPPSGPTDSVEVGRIGR